MDSNYVALSDGSVVTARAMVRVPASQKWNAERVLSVTGTPLALNTMLFDQIEKAEDPHRGHQPNPLGGMVYLRRFGLMSCHARHQMLTPN